MASAVIGRKIVTRPLLHFRHGRTDLEETVTVSWLQRQVTECSRYKSETDRELVGQSRPSTETESMAALHKTPTNPPMLKSRAGDGKPANSAVIRPAQSWKSTRSHSLFNPEAPT